MSLVSRDIIVIGASAGGIETMLQLVRQLPADFPAAIFLTVHFPAHTPSYLPNILNRASALKALHPANGQPIETGHIYVAPPDQHLLIHPGKIALVRGPREHGLRPSIDPLFRSAARSYGPRVVGVVLSGTLDDGTSGLEAIKARGGVSVVQDPEEALYSGMPQSAIDNVTVDYILTLNGIVELLNRLSREPIVAVVESPPSRELIMETDMSAMDPTAMQEEERPGSPSTFGCPECGGVLWELADGNLVRFRCRVGHAWSGDTLMAEQFDALEDALWTALRTLKESATLANRLAARARNRGNTRMASHYDFQAEEANQRAETIRQVLTVDEPLTSMDTAEVMEVQSERME